MAINFFNKFLDFIGLVDEPGAGTRDDDFDTTAARTRTAGTTRRKTSVLNDEFANEPRMTRAQTQRERTAPAAANDQFDADEAWETRRPEYGYGARTQQRAQSTNRPSAGRYNTDPRGGAQNTRTSSRYDGASFDGRSYSENGGYQSENYRASGSYNSSNYGTSSYPGRSASASSSNAYGGESMTEQNSASSYQKHRIATFSIRSVDECKNVIRTLLEKKSVLLSLEEMDSVQAQRAVDTMSGATFAIGAKMNRASERSWLLTPSTVEIDEGVQPQDNGTFGMQYR